MGLPDGVMFALTPDNKLEQQHNFVIGAAVLPPSHVIGTEGRIQYAPRGAESGSDITNMSIHFAGVTGGPEDAKKVLCQLVDDLWDAINAND